MKGMGVLMDNEKPAIRFMAQHWPLSLIIGYALYKRLRFRHKNKSLSAFTAVTDAGIALSPLAVLAVISMAASKKEQASHEQVLNVQSMQGLPAPKIESHSFAGKPPPQFFASRPPHEVEATTPAPAEEVVVRDGPPPSARKAGSGPFASFLD